MYNKSFRGKKTDGFSGKGGFGGGKRFGGNSDWKPMHKATCAECGSSCEVPFKPNGSRPVLCSHCFKKDGGSAPRDRFSDDRRPAFSERGERSSGGNSDQVQEQLKAMNAKLDAIIEALDNE